MSSTFGGLEIAKSGLSVAMANLEITGHNIANANTKGYTRQRLITAAIEPGNASYLLSQMAVGRVGRGVDIIDIQQIRSDYLDSQYRRLNSDYTYSQSRMESLSYLQGLFNSELEAGSGITGLIENFYGALKDFKSDTTSEEFRTSVQQSALSMAENFNVVYDEMSALWHNQNDSIRTDAETMNGIARQLSELNQAIAKYERSGDNANDLRDKRNLLLDELSAYGEITYNLNEENASMVDVQIGGIDLVRGNAYHQIQSDSAASHQAEINGLTTQIAALNARIAAGAVTAEEGQAAIGLLVEELGQYLKVSAAANGDNGDLVDISFSGVALVSGEEASAVETATAKDLTAWAAYNRHNLTLDGQELSIESGTVTGGKLYTYMEMVSSDGSDESLGGGILYYMKELNSLARTIAQTINGIHQGGYTYPKDGSASVNGINLFKAPVDENGQEDYSQLTAGNFSISDEVLASVWNIAGSSREVTPGGTDSGNAEVAEALYNTITSGEFYSKLNAIVDHLAIAIYTGSGIEDTKSSLLDSVESKRMAMSGISINEEATNLIIFQQSYNACARLLTTMDQMLETLISNTGLVGR